MALTATATQGMEFYRWTTTDEILYLPGDPGVTYTKGDQVTASQTAGTGGLIIPATGTAVDILGVVMQTTVVPASTTAFPKPGAFDPVDRSGSNLCLVPVKMNVAAGLAVYKCTFANHWDDTATSYSAPTITFTTAAAGTNADDIDGAMIYVYEGPGIGEVNVIDNSDATTAATHRNFATALTSASKYIAVCGEAADNRGIGFSNRIDAKDVNELDAADGSNDGKWQIYMDWRESAALLKNLTVSVIAADSLYVA